MIINRRSIRNYKKHELPQTTVEKLLEATRQAPSAGNVQPWEFLVASTQKTKTDLSFAAYGQKDLQDASVVFVVCADEKQAAEAYGSRGKTLYCIQDTAAAIQNILLTACAMGLGTCWIGAFKEDEVKKSHQRSSTFASSRFNSSRIPERIAECTFKKTATRNYA
jgi:nitroreductase